MKRKWIAAGIVAAALSVSASVWAADAVNTDYWQELCHQGYRTHDGYCTRDGQYCWPDHDAANCSYENGTCPYGHSSNHHAGRGHHGRHHN